MTVLYIVFFQALVGAVASSGEWTVIAALARGEGSGLWEIFVLTCTFVIPLLIVIVPQVMGQSRPWDKVSEQTRTFVPAWLAAAAALMTFLCVVEEHSFRAPLA